MSDLCNLFQILTADQQARLLAKYLPSGKALIAKDNKNTNLYKFIKSQAYEFSLISDKLNDTICEYDAQNTTKYIEEYERMLGIPEAGCFKTSVSIDRRRNQIYAKILAIGTQTCDDLVEVIAALGITIKCETGSELGVFPVSFPWRFFGSTFEAAHTLNITFIDFSDVNTFPVSFPWFFSGESYINDVKCFIKTLIPANCRVFYSFSESNLFDFIDQEGDVLVTQSGDSLILKGV
jgi:hypothetical protein